MESEATETDQLDTGTTDTSTEDIQSDAASAETDSTATVDSATPAESPADGNAGSLASGEPTDVKNPPAQTKPQEDWKKRHDGQFQANQRLTLERKQALERAEAFEAELKGLKAKLEGLDLQKVRDFQQHQQATANPVWHPQHPDNAKFQRALDTHNYYVRLAHRAPPEQREWINQQYEADVSAADRQAIQQFRDHGQQELLRLQQNPEGYLQERVAKMVEQKIQEFQQSTVGNYRANMEARSELSELLQKYPELNAPEHMQRAYHMVAQGIPMPSALREIRMEILDKRLSVADQAKRSVEEKERLLQANSSISRDPAVNANVNIYEEAKKIAEQRKIKNPWDPRFMRILDDLNRKYQIKG